AERTRGGPYGSLDDLLDRIGGAIGPEAVKILVRAGALDGVNGGGDAEAVARRPELMWRIAAWQRAREKAASRVRALWAADEAPGPPEDLEPYGGQALLEQETGALGFLVSRHPLTLYRDEIA